MLSMIALLVCQTHAHASTYDNPLLNRLGPETLDNDRWKSGVCLASERIVVATITRASATHLGHRVETDATLSVDRMIKNTGPPTTTIAAKIPGGLFEGATYTSSSANGVVPVPGTTWAMVLGYGGDFTSTPRLIQLFPVPEGVPIPRQSQLVDAYEEYCNE